jgi:hypothetical protein
MKRLMLTCALLLVATLGAHAQSLRFEDYPARIYKGRNAPVRIDSKDARQFRSRLREAVKNDQASFAGQYIFTGWGCGASCFMFALIDARSGRVYFPGFSVQWFPPVEHPFKYRLDSRLLIIEGILNEQDEPQSRYFYEWRNNKLRLIKSEPM